MPTLTDLFAGAGGSSTGASQVPGVEVVWAANHWQLAVDTHATNHPNADHHCADISQMDPRYYATTDILWASPSCTNHSIAQGRKRADRIPDLFGDTLPDEAAERSRATMWDVPRFAEHHKYRAVIVENVVDVVDWVMYPAWLSAMTLLGYEHRIVYLNSMHAAAAGNPAAQSRDRFYGVFWRKGERRPDFDKWVRPAAHCPDCDTHVRAVQAWKNDARTRGRYRAQYNWRCPNVACRNRIIEPATLPAASVIDWTVRGNRIGDRDKPLADKTRARIQSGLGKFLRPIGTSIGGTSVPLLVPVEGREGKSASSVDLPIRTMTTRNETALVAPPMLVPAGGTWNDSAAVVDHPMRTRTTRETDALVVPDLGGAWITELRGGGSDTRAVADPLATVTASGNHHALTVAGSWDYWAGIYSYTNKSIRPLGEPLPTQTTIVSEAVLAGFGVPSVDDCLLRMLTSMEAAKAQDFPDLYVLLVNKREQMRLVGNAVSVNAARDLVHMVTEALTGEPLDLAAA